MKISIETVKEILRDDNSYKLEVLLFNDDKLYKVNSIDDVVDFKVIFFEMNKQTNIATVVVKANEWKRESYL